MQITANGIHHNKQASDEQGSNPLSFYLYSVEEQQKTDEQFMREALKEAQLSYDADEVPVGAVVVCNNRNSDTQKRSTPATKSCRCCC